MKIIDVKKQPAMKNIHNVNAATIYDSEFALTVHLTLQSGESLKPHITPVDVFFYVLEGEPTIMVGKEKQKVKADYLIESPAKIPHCIYNKTDHLVRILVVKVPKPTTETKLL
ncbi:MAG: cupin domain-containing protein [Candidatus Marinimicrobia bacterium]|nr:cupin domain-containing protein [Candidatus Neomarinimicrobiota bacterium]